MNQNSKEKNAEKLGLKSVYKKKRNSKSLYKVNEQSPINTTPRSPADSDVFWIQVASNSVSANFPPQPSGI